MKKSIISNECGCRYCGKPANHVHHVIYGTANRQKADEDGLTVRICFYCHENMHHNRRWINTNRELKRVGQLCWMIHNKATEEDFIKRYGRSYL